VQGVGSGGHLPLAVPDFVWRRCRSHHRQQRGGSHDDERRRAGGVDGREDGGAEEGRVEEDRDEEPRTEQPAGRRPTISPPTTATNHTDTVPRRVEQQLTNLGRTRTGRERAGHCKRAWRRRRRLDSAGLPFQIERGAVCSGLASLKVTRGDRESNATWTSQIVRTRSYSWALNGEQRAAYLNE
jgi:hypothetical protein